MIDKTPYAEYIDVWTALVWKKMKITFFASVLLIFALLPSPPHTQVEPMTETSERSNDASLPSCVNAP